MAKQLNVNLAFTADTTQAKKQLQDLQNQLTKLTSLPFGENKQLGLTKEIQEATQAAAQLKVQLDNATNKQTGKLDLGKFTESMQASGMSLAKYREQLDQLGPAGRQAFLSLAQSISNAEVPLRRSSQLLDQFWTALKNTARWQLSSSALHGFMGAIQGAYGYAQDLDKSLNSIRVVSGQSSEQMAELAEHANQAAQALNTSTLAYTDAALIYYQQGLDPEEVARRTETTLKMSNVTGESAEAVSSYMTAIWNNFAKGSTNLEHFADVITALGAATASSSEEIANGMQQFAAVADTVGLSYEYAASALATIVAQTRQSESTVGNSLRTIFSRLESVSLGETLEDGLELTKYTKALQEIGVNVLKQNGDLKDMDTILEEIGNRWDTLSKAQQVAVAQTVGGVRQYTNLIALFDNWDKFQRNLGVAQDSEGTLQKQADIYAESWEAARKRVQAAWQAIYQDLIDEKFFITVLNGFEKILSTVDALIDSAGGLKGVISGLGIVLTSVFNDQLTRTISDIGYNISMLTEAGRQKIIDQKNMVWQEAQKLSVDTGTAEGAAQAMIFENTAILQKSLLDNASKMSEEQLKINQLLLDGNKVLQDRLLLEAKNLDAIEKEIEALQLKAQREAIKENGKINSNDFNESLRTLNKNASNYGARVEALQEIREGIRQGQIETKKWQEVLGTLRLTSGPTLYKQLKNLVQEEENGYNKFIDQNDALTIVLDHMVKAEEYRIKSIETFSQNTGASEETAEQLLDSIEKRNEAYNQEQESIDQLKQHEEQLIAFQQKAIETDTNYAQSIVTTANTISQLTFGLNSLKGAFDALGNSDLSWFEKLQRVIMSISMSLPMLSRSLPQLGQTLNGVIGYFNQKQSNGILSNLIENNKSEITKIFDSFGGEEQLLTLIGSNGALGDAAQEASEKIKNLREANISLTSRIQGNVSVAQDLKVVLTGVGEKATDLITNFGPLAIKIGLVVAAFYALKKVYDLWYQNTPEGKLEAANKAIEEQQKKVNELKEGYDNLRSTIEEYNNLREKGLEDKKGFERIEAVNEENEKIRELIDTYNLWDEISKQGGLQYDSNGLIVFNEELQNAVLANQQLEISKERQILLQEELNKLTAQNDKDYKDEYQGEKIQVRRKTGETTVEAGGETHTQDTWETVDVTRQVAQVMNTLELNLDQLNNDTDSQEKLRNALVEANIVTKEDVQTIIDTLLEMSQNDTQRQEFNNLQNTQGTFDMQSDAVKTDIARTQWTESFGDDFSLLSDDSQEKLINALKDSDINLQQLINDGKDFGEILDELGVKAEDLSLKVSETKFERPVDEDVDADELLGLSDFIQTNAGEIEGLSDQLIGLEDASNRVAEAVLRFDDAIQDVTDNYQTWMDSLNSGAIQDQVKAMNEMKDAYGDLLDISGDSLSADFLKNTQNLDDMKAAIEGDIDAYDRLQEAAMKDIVTHVFLDDTNAINAAYSLANELDGVLATMEIGAEIDPIAMSSLYDKMNDIINAADMTAQQASDLLASMGVDAEIEEVTVTKPKNEEMVDVIPTIDESAGELKVPVIAADGELDYNTVPVQGIKYQPKHHTDEAASAETVTALKVKSARKSSGGGFKYNQSTHGAGSQGAGKTPSSKGGSGNKGSTPKEKKKTVKEHKEPKKEEDRYHDLKERIDDVNTALKRMGKTKDRVYGKAKLKYMDQELARMKDQIALTKEYIKEAEKYLKVDRAALEGIKKGAAFDENGMLTNYEEVLKNITEAYNNQLAQYNAAVDKFNASEQEEGDNTAFEAEEKALAKAEKTFNENKQILKQYEDTYNLIQKQQEELIDQLNEYYDTLLENVDIKVKMKIDLEEDDKKLLEWMYKYIGDSADYAADKIANLSKQMKASKNELDIMREGITEIFKNHDMDVDVNNLDADDLVAQLRAYMNQEGLASEMTEAEVEKLREYRDALMEYYDQMYDNMVKGNEVLREMMEEQDDRIQRQLNNYDRLADAIEHWKDIAELTGEDVLGLNSQELNRLDQSRITNDWNRMDSTKRYMEEREREYIKLQQSYAEAEAMGDELVLAEVRKNLELAEDLYHDAQDAWRDSWKKAQEDVNQAAENAMDRMVKDYKKALGDLDVLMERYDRQRENNHLYLEDYEKYHELNKSLKDLQNSMNNTNNQKMLMKMRDLEDEINANMQSGVKISERQAEVIARRVALLQAEAELMDAQNAKSAVRMTRDNEGNFSYTYTADQEQIDDAEQNYGDKFYELMKYEKDEIEALEAERLQSEAQYIEDLRNLWDEYRNGDISSYEEYLALVDELTAQYEERRLYYFDQEAFLFDEQARLRDEDWKDFEEITGNKLAEQWNFVDEFEDTITGQLLPGYQTLDEAQEEWARVMSEGYETAKTTAAAWQEATQNTLKQAGVDADNFRGTMLKDLQDIDTQSEITKDKIEDMISGSDGMAEQFNKAIDASDQFNQEFAAHNEEEREQIRKTVEELNEMIRKLAETTQEEKNLETQSYITKGAVDTMAEAAESAQGAVEALTDAANGLAAAANAAADAIRNIPSMPGGSNGGPGGPGLSGISINRTGGYQGKLSNSDRRWLTNISSAATGMYTGAWGNEGKLAILHEKELVLNRTDTENMLDIVGTVRRIVASIGSGDFLNNLADSINNHVSNINKPNGVLDQNVHIEASFPNVQSHSEIELALNNLINSASQYVNRK